MTRAPRWLLLGGALASACSALIDPDTSRLNRFNSGTDAGPTTDLVAPTDDGAPTDLGTPDAGPVDARVNDTGTDAGTDAGDDVVSPVDAPDVPPSDVVTSRCAASCDDGVECTIDSCDEDAGVCAHRTDDTVCGDREVCDATMGCTRVDCATDNDCQDGTLCNGRERCDAHHCAPGTPVLCDDGVECTVDRCDPGTGACANTADNARCDDGAFCNGAETCDAVHGCATGAAPDCDDHIGCTTDHCDDAAGRCQHAPNPAACAAPGPCVTATCDPATGCRNTPVTNYCDSYCSTGAICNVTTGLCGGGGAARDCGDGDPCTADTCDPVAHCRSTPIDADGDGYPAARIGTATCAHGDDCNDGDPAVHRGATEVCNGVDDNCDGAVDEGGVCIPPGEDCAHAIAVDLTGTTTTATRTGTTAGHTSDFTSVCSGAGPDLVYAVTIPGDADLLAEAAPTGTAGDPVVSVRDVCAGAEVGCNDNATQRTRDGRVWLRGRTGGGTTRVVYVVVDDSGAAGGAFTLRLTRAAATAPGNCGNSPLFDVTSGGTVVGRTTTGYGSHYGTCGGNFLGEDVLVFNAAARQSINLLLATANQVTYVRQGQCGGARTNQLACFTGSRAVTVDAGQAWIIVDASRDAGEGTYILRVQP